MKRIFFVVVSLITLVYLFRICGDIRSNRVAEECVEAYQILSEYPDFDSLRLENDKLAMRFDNNEKTTFEPVPDWAKPFSKDVIAAFKTDDDVYFIMGGAVDDIWGVLLSRDDRIASYEVKRSHVLASGEFGDLSAFWFSSMK